MCIRDRVSEEARNLVEVTKECLNIGMDAVKPWGHVGDIGAAIHKYATSRGYSVVVDFAGHGVGKEDVYKRQGGNCSFCCFYQYRISRVH